LFFLNPSQENKNIKNQSGALLTILQSHEFKCRLSLYLALLFIKDSPKLFS